MEERYRYSIRNILVSILGMEIIFWVVFLSVKSYYDKLDNFMFEYEHRLWGFIVIPFLIGIYIFQIMWKNNAIHRYGSIKLFRHLSEGISSTKSITKFLLIRNAFALLVIAAANPQFGYQKKTVKSRGIDLMIAVDVSNSMLADDLVPGVDRLSIAKKSIQRLIDKLHGDRIGIVVFAGSAYVQLPITSDYTAAKLFLSGINPGMISSQGTAIGRAIETCLQSFDYDNGSNKGIIIISDGENHEDNAVLAAKKAQDKSVVIHTIGMGTPRGATIPEFKNGRKSGVKRDFQGNTVLTKLNEGMLVEIANKGGGTYTRAKGGNVGLNPLVASINKVEKTELGEKGFEILEDQFQWFLGIGILLLIVDPFIFERRSKLIDNLKLFE